MLSQQIDDKNPLTFAWVLGEVVLLQPVRLGLAALARSLARPARAPRVGVPPMSRTWLQQHAADVDKHGDGLG